MWKKALYGSAKDQRLSALQNYLTEEGAKLEAEVEALGGYNRVLQAITFFADDVYYRRREQTPREKRALKRVPGANVHRLLRHSSSLNLKGSRFLVLIRLLGVLIAYGVHDPEEGTEKVVRSVQLSLRPLYSFQEIGQALGDVYAEGRARFGTISGYGSIAAEFLVHESRLGQPLESRALWRGTSTRGMMKLGKRKHGHPPFDVLDLMGDLFAYGAAPCSPLDFASMMFDCNYNQDWILNVLEHVY